MLSMQGCMTRRSESRDGVTAMPTRTRTASSRAVSTVPEDTLPTDVEAHAPGDAAPRKSADSRTRLVVELGRPASQLLEELTRLEDLNKTTIVNRAIQVYGLLRMAQENGGEVHMSDTADGALHSVRFI